MKSAYKKGHIKKFCTVLLFSLFVVLTSCVSKPFLASMPVKAKYGKEMLVAEDISSGDTAYMPVWCGNNAVLFKRSTNIELIDFTNKKKIEISSDPEEWPLNCTPDGRWVFNYRTTFISNPWYKEDDGTEEGGYTPVIPLREVYGYEVATGKRQKFGVTDHTGSSTEWVSPDGKKISLKPPDYTGEVEAGTGPWPDAVWFSNKEWDAGEYAWFKDSSGMAALIWYGIGVEFFGDGGWAKAFTLWGPRFGVASIKTDRENRVYFTITEDAAEMDDDIVRLIGGKYLLKRCSIKSRELVCETILARKYFGPYEILPDGDILFNTVYENCIRCAFPGVTDDECVIGGRYGDTNYDDVILIGLSPDGRRLAFKRLKKTARFKGTSKEDDYFRYDLFLIDMTED